MIKSKLRKVDDGFINEAGKHHISAEVANKADIAVAHVRERLSAHHNVPIARSAQNARISVGIKQKSCQQTNPATPGFVVNSDAMGKLELRRLEKMSRRHVSDTANLRCKESSFAK